MLSLKMNFSCIWLLLVLLLLASCIISAIKIHCNYAENIREDHIHYCCKHPDGHNDITEKCATETGFKVPSKNEEAPEDVTVEQVVRGGCWAECVFEKFGFLNSQRELDMTAVRKHYKEVHALDTEYEREMIDAFEHCHGKSEEAAAKFIKTINAFGQHNHKMCGSQATVILSCVIHNFFHNCPKGRWAHTKECTETREFAKKCKDALTTM